MGKRGIARSIGRARIETAVEEEQLRKKVVSPAQLGGRGLKLFGNAAELAADRIARSIGRARIETCRGPPWPPRGSWYRPLNWAGAD